MAVGASASRVEFRSEVRMGDVPPEWVDGQVFGEKAAGQSGSRIRQRGGGGGGTDRGVAATARRRKGITSYLPPPDSFQRPAAH